MTHSVNLACRHQFCPSFLIAGNSAAFVSLREDHVSGRRKLVTTFGGVQLGADTPAASAIGAKLFVMDLLCWDAHKSHKEDRCSLAMWARPESK
jgi:hypothetical protein